MERDISNPANYFESDLSKKSTTNERLIELFEVFDLNQKNCLINERDEVLNDLMSSLLSKDVDMFFRTVDQLIELKIQKDKVINALVKKLTAIDAEVRYNAVKRLIEIEEEAGSVIEALVKDLKAIDISVRYKAVDFLIELGQKQDKVFETLIRDLNNEYVDVRHSSARRLIQLGEEKERVMRILLNDLNIDNQKYYPVAAELLINIGINIENITEEFEVTDKAYERLSQQYYSLDDNFELDINPLEMTADFLPEINNKHYLLAHQHRVLGENETSESAYKDAIKHFPDSFTYCEYGHFLYQQKRYDEAIKNLLEAIELSRDHEFLIYELYEKHVIESCLSKIVSKFGQVKMSVKSISYYLLTLSCFILEKDCEIKMKTMKSLSKFSMLVKLTTDAIGYHLLAHLYHTVGDEEAAKIYFKRAGSYLDNNQDFILEENLKEEIELPGCYDLLPSNNKTQSIASSSSLIFFQSVSDDESKSYVENESNYDGLLSKNQSR